MSCCIEAAFSKFDRFILAVTNTWKAAGLPAYDNCSNDIHQQLTWKARNECGSQNQVRYSLSQFLQQLHCVLLRRPVHAQESHVVDVLQGYVNVFAHLHITITLYSNYPYVLLKCSHD